MPPLYCPSCLSTISSTVIANRLSSNVLRTPFLLSANPLRHASQSSKSSSKSQPATAKKSKKKARTTYATPDLKSVNQFSLCDAMRYLKAAEVGRAPTSSKYELHVRLRTPKNGAVVRNRLRLPHPVKTSQRICVICPADSTHAQAALDAGASVVGEQEVFDAVKDGRIEFERCICHQDSLSKLAASGVARILGPRGLMPNAKMGTVVKDVGATVRDMAGGSEYRERLGVVRMAVGQLGFTPEEVQRNVRAFLESVKRDIAGLSDRISKDIHEVVISSTHGPGLSLSGEFRNANSIPPEDLSVV